MNTENTGTLTNLVSGLHKRHESAEKPQELDNDTSIMSNQIQNKGQNKLINEQKNMMSRTMTSADAGVIKGLTKKKPARELTAAE